MLSAQGSGEKRPRWLTPEGGKASLLCRDAARQHGFWDLLLLGEDCPREAIGRCGVDQLQDLLVPLLWVDVHCEDRAKNFLYSKIIKRSAGTASKNKLWALQYPISQKSDKEQHPRTNLLYDSSLCAQRTPPDGTCGPFCTFPAPSLQTSLTSFMMGSCGSLLSTMHGSMKYPTLSSQPPPARMVRLDDFLACSIHFFIRAKD